MQHQTSGIHSNLQKTDFPINLESSATFERKLNTQLFKQSSPRLQFDACITARLLLLLLLLLLMMMMMMMMVMMTMLCEDEK